MRNWVIDLEIGHDLVQLLINFFTLLMVGIFLQLINSRIYRLNMCFKPFGVLDFGELCSLQINIVL